MCLTWAVRRGECPGGHAWYQAERESENFGIFLSVLVMDHGKR